MASRDDDRRGTTPRNNADTSQVGQPAHLPESLLLRELSRRGIGLQFAPALEGPFLDFQKRFFLVQARCACVAALILLLILHAASIWIGHAPDRLVALQALVTFGLLAPVLIGAFFLLSGERGHQRLHVAMSVCVLVAGGVTLALPTLYAGFDAHYHDRFGEFTLVFLFLLAGLPFRVAAVFGAGLLAAMGLRIAVLGLPASQTLSGYFVLCALGAVGAAACYLLERAVRRNFLTEQLYFGRSVQDALTRVMNRRGWDEAAGRAWAQARRDQSAVGMAVIDIVQFKAYNDGLGHPAGDDALREVARCLRTQVARRPFDLVARLGGEEFAILWYSTEASLVDKLAERVREAIESLGIEHPAGGPLTVSVGYTHLVPDTAVSVDDAYALADSALYAAKMAGRNRVRMSSAQLLSAANAVKLDNTPQTSGAT